jgi:hypothetical protein
MSRAVSTEKNIQDAVLQWLNIVPECKVWRQNVGGMEYLKADGRKGIVRFGQPGMADLTGIICGVRLEVEIKRPGQVPRPDQESWLNFIRGMGGIAFWCDSLGSCVVQLRLEFAKRSWPWLKSWEVW